MISTGSGRRRNRPKRAVKRLKRVPCRMLTEAASAEQGGIDQRVELRQRFGAQFLGVELQELRRCVEVSRDSMRRRPHSHCAMHSGVTWSASATCACNRPSSRRRRRNRTFTGSSEVNIRFVLIDISFQYFR